MMKRKFIQLQQEIKSEKQANSTCNVTQLIYLVLPKIQSSVPLQNDSEFTYEEFKKLNSSNRYGDWNKELNSKLVEALQKQKRINEYWYQNVKKNHKPVEDRIKSVEVALRKEKNFGIPKHRSKPGFKRVTLEQLSKKFKPLNPLAHNL